ncbi:DNase I-like protein [Rhizophagus clarus]|uniref:DNase I-like protein n=1 Tax=Rhizophagus clarus TaxID=94130 RepID=A0A8H3LRC0_9GLOM|nr:DNase I-like protein [Rhizophagus clarus]
MNTSNSKLLPKTTSSMNTAQVDQITSGGDDDSKPNRSIKSIIEQLNQNNNNTDETTNDNPTTKPYPNVITQQQQLLQTTSLKRDSNSSDNRINGQPLQKFKNSVNVVSAVNTLNHKRSPPPIPPSRSKPQTAGNIKPIIPPPSSTLKNTSPTLSHIPNSAPLQYSASNYHKVLDNDNPFDDSKETDSKDADPFSDVNEMDNESSAASLSSRPRRHSHSHVTSRGIGNKLIDDTSIDTNSNSYLRFNQSIPSLPPKKYDRVLHKHNESDLENGPPSLPPRPQNKSAPPLPDRPRKPDRNNNKEKNKSKREKEESDSDSDHSADRASDTPDATRVNRRPPKFDDVKDIYSKVTTRTFGIAGKFVVTSSGHTRIWLLTDGTNTRTISHDDSKAVSLCWRPTRRVEDIGRYIWCGTQDGHLFAIDINGEKYIEVNKKAHNSQINFILHHELQLWTLDDSGKLLIWSEGEDGVISLKSKPQSVKVSLKVNCAIVVGKHLWLSSVDIGNVKCMTYMTRKNDSNDSFFVYIGHDDGKISVWDAETYEKKSVVTDSVYCINSLLSVGDYLWVGFHTGMIHVYDVRSSPWIVIKEWKAHKAPIVDMQLDETGLLRVDRLQVASLSEEGQIITWDGLMTEDWIDDEMVAREREYCDSRNVKVLICSWNIDASKPVDLENSTDSRQFLKELFKSTESPDIIVVGFQEIIDLESKKMTAKTMLMSKKKTDKQLNENITHRYKLWYDKLIEIVQQYTNQEYEVLVSDNLVGLFTCIFAKKSEKDKIRDTDVAIKKTGLKGLHAAGQTQIKERNTDVAKILDNTVFPSRANNSWNDNKGVFAHGGDGSMVLDHEIVFFSGDLNYRISLPREEVLDAIEDKDYSLLLEYDQLRKQMNKNPGFRLRSFIEGVPNFAPTYKYDPGKNIYDTSEKKRTPSWCDRILHFGTNIEQEHYSRYECKISDHRPISGAFKIRIKTIRKSHQDKVKYKVERTWKEEVIEDKKREIMIKWIKSCGWNEKIAVKTLDENYGDLRKTVDELNKRR